LKPGLVKAWQATDDTIVKNLRLLLNGCDFSTPQPDLTNILQLHAHESKGGMNPKYYSGLKAGKF
jgi:hypothetical protein